MLEIRNLTKTFGNVTALSNVSFNVKKGEFFGLLGPNGAGKSTLMDLIIGYTEPKAGEIILDDETILFNNIKIKRKIGYVPQEISLYPEFSALQNLKVFGSFFELPKKTLDERIDKVLELVQLENRKKSKVKEFSGGMKRRLNLAASILHDPDLILCDEPTVGVDPQSRNAIFDMLKQLNSEGKTIIYTTHYMEEAERLCSKLAIIDHGNIIAGGTLSELVEGLGKKEKIKILKNPQTENARGRLSGFGVFVENDFDFELLPEGKYTDFELLFAEFKSLGILNEFIEINRPSLEDVFLTMTGRSLRD